MNRTHNAHKTHDASNTQRVAIGAYFAELVPRIGCLAAAILLHKHILVGCLRAPLLFFDTTPTGRILSRFSKDIDVVDTTLPLELCDMIYCLFEVREMRPYTVL